jgi:ATP-binding cassette subfamily F protein uup
MLADAGRKPHHDALTIANPIDMPLLTLENLSLAYGHRPLLDQVDLRVYRGERICLIGRNGAGKSSLLRVIGDEVQADDGQIWRRQGIRISHLHQEVPDNTPETVYQVVAAGLGELGGLLSDYHNAAHHIAPASKASVQRMAELQHAIDDREGWSIERKVETALSRLSLPADKPMIECSGGIRRRVMLAQALVSEPDLLLLDEPTNHMDIAAIAWLEEFLSGFGGALMFVTHDRTLVRNLATRIVELDRGRLSSFPGHFDGYLKRKDEMLESEARSLVKMEKRLAEEETWIRKGIKARRTRNEGRVRRLQALREARRQRIAPQGQVNLKVDSGESSAKLVVELQNVSLAMGGATIVDSFWTRVLRGDRIGIVGPNGCGKSTLLNLMLGALEPDSGRVIRGARLELAYFDQQREQLQLDKSVRENINDGADYVQARGRSRHVVGYLRDFLFSYDRLDSPASTLSGGERNRLLLARLFTRTANLLVLDEPTNDLDVDTLELLEDLLADYEGTLLVVSHDRSFLDNVVTSVMVFEGDGRIGEYVGGYGDYLQQHKAAARDGARREPKAVAPATRKTSRRSPQQRLGYNEKRELASLPEQIEALEKEQGTLEATISEADFYRGDKTTITDTLKRLENLHEALRSAYERWEFLDKIDR